MSLPNSFTPSIQEGELYQQFTFAIQMLPSVNAKYGYRHQVLASYRNRELEEVARIIQQRDSVRWPPPTDHDRYMLLYCFTVERELKQDIHNFVKPTCDLFGKGRWEWKGKRKVFIPHADILRNDNRVLREYLIKRAAGPDEQELWGIIRLVRFHADNSDQIPFIALAQSFESYCTSLFSRSSHDHPGAA